MTSGVTMQLSTKEQLAAKIIEQFLKSSDTPTTGLNLVGAVSVLYDAYLRQIKEIAELRIGNNLMSDEISALRHKLDNAYGAIQIVDEFRFDMFL